MKQSWMWSLAAVIAASVVSWAVFVFTRPEALPPGFLYGNGHIEATEVRIASEVGGRVLSHELTEGRSVRQGDTLVRIDAETSRDKLRVAEGELETLQRARAALEAQVEVWNHHSAMARRQVDRVRELLDSSLANQRDLDEAENGLREAQGQLKSLKSQCDALDGKITSAAAQVDLARSELGKTEIRSPLDGTVLVRAVETGEIVQAGQSLAVIADLGRLELTVYIPERDIGKVRLDCDARVKIDAFPDRYFDARVKRVDEFAQFTPRDIHLPEERTRMVYGVTLAIDNPGGYMKAGMPADAWIRSDESRRWPLELPIPGS